MTLLQRITQFVQQVALDLKSKADLVNGKVPLNQLEDATLSDDQFEQLPNGKIGIKTSYLQSLGLGGAPSIPVITKQPISRNLTVGDTLTLEVDFTGTGILTWQGSTDGGNTFPYENGHDKIITVPNVQLTDKGHYRAQIVYSGGIMYSDVAAVTVNEATVEQPGGSYTVERTLNVNFGSEYGTYNAAGWNALKASSALLGTANGFTSPALKDSTGTTSTLTIKNSGIFTGSNAEISSTQTTAGNTGIFINEIVNSGWIFNGSSAAGITIEGLNPAKFYQLYFLLPTQASSEQVRNVVINGVTKSKTTSTALSSFGVAANGLQDPELVVFNNITGSSIQAVINRVSGNWDQYLACIVIQETNIAKP